MKLLPNVTKNSNTFRHPIRPCLLNPNQSETPRRRLPYLSHRYVRCLLCFHAPTPTALASSPRSTSLLFVPFPPKTTLHCTLQEAEQGGKKTRIFPLTYPATDLRKYAVIRCRLHGFLRSEGTSGRGSSALLPFRCCCSPHVLSGD
jgi:hypothetical protein